MCFNLHHGEHCILRLSQISITVDSSKNKFFLTGATDGYIKVFKQKLFKFTNLTSYLPGDILPQVIMPDIQLKSHQSGINALDAKQISGKIFFLYFLIMINKIYLTCGNE